MKFVKFTISGKTAFFKKPDVNKQMYFTFGNIHKVALLGMLGAILGYKGYNFQALANNKKYTFVTETQIYPEFYEKLNGLEIAIVPKAHMFNKKLQVFNNSVGYASEEKGGNLIVKEVWLENPKWDIYIALTNEEAEKLKNNLEKYEFVYLPYLGKNDHFANIENIEVLEGEKVENANRIDSLFLRSQYKVAEEKKGRFSLNSFTQDQEPKFKYQEKLPIALEETQNLYEYETFLFTNKNVEKIVNGANLYNVGDKTIMTI